MPLRRSHTTVVVRLFFLIIIISFFFFSFLGNENKNKREKEIPLARETRTGFAPLTTFFETLSRIREKCRRFSLRPGLYILRIPGYFVSWNFSFFRQFSSVLPRKFSPLSVPVPPPPAVHRVFALFELFELRPRIVRAEQIPRIVSPPDDTLNPGNCFSGLVWPNETQFQRTGRLSFEPVASLLKDIPGFCLVGDKKFTKSNALPTGRPARYSPPLTHPPSSPSHPDRFPIFRHDAVKLP